MTPPTKTTPPTKAQADLEPVINQAECAILTNVVQAILNVTRPGEKAVGFVLLAFAVATPGLSVALTNLNDTANIKKILKNHLKQPTQ